MPEQPILSRRDMLAVAGSAAVALHATAAIAQQTAPSSSAASRPLPPYVSWKHADSMIVHTANTLETKRTAFGSSVITPTERLFVRNNLPAPDGAIVENRDAWQIAIEGVGRPKSLTVADLKTMGLETTATVLQCSGNGRGYFANRPSGTPWQVGAAGCVIWSGVPVRDIAAALGGVVAGMEYMTGTGGETTPAGLDPLTVMVERSVPLSGMQDALLAWELNGEPLPLAHGGPLRLIIPGYSGVNNVKYVKRLAFTKEQSKAAIQNTGYRISVPGQKGDPSQPSVWTMGLKSWVLSPTSDAEPVKAGNVQIRGVAMGGLTAVAKVDVSTDGGKTWQAARLVGPDLGKYAWREFAIAMELRPGTYDIACRATDTAGKVQEDFTPENTGGYLNAGWVAHSIKVKVV